MTLFKLYYLLIHRDRVNSLGVSLCHGKNSYLLLKDDIEEGDLNRPEMTAKLVCTLETAIFRAMQEKQYSAVASNAKVLMKLVGLETK